MEVRIGAAPGPQSPPWLHGARDLVAVSPPEGPKDAFTLTRVYQPDGSRPTDQLVRCLVNGQPVPRDPTNQRPVQAQDPGPYAEEKTTFFQPGPAFPGENPSLDGWYVAGESTRVSLQGQPLVESDVRGGPRGFQETVRLYQPQAEDVGRVQAVTDIIQREDLGQELERARSQSVEQILAWDSQLLKTRGADLQRLYGDRRDLAILELGPNTTTVVVQALCGSDNGNTYLGVDLNEVALAKQREALQHVGLQGKVEQKVADLRQLPVPDSSQDLVVAYASFPLGAPADTAIAALQEVGRVLRPGGEFLTTGWDLTAAAPRTIGYALSHFDVVGTPAPGSGVILRKKPQ